MARMKIYTDKNIGKPKSIPKNSDLKKGIKQPKPQALSNRSKYSSQ